jgi:alpha-glucosidase
MVRSIIEAKHFALLGDVCAVERTERGLLLAVGEERFRADVLRSDIVRLKISRAGKFDERPTFAASFAAAEAPPFEIEETQQAITLTTESMRLVISREPFALDAYRRDGSIIFQDDRDAAGRPRGYLQLNDSFIITRRIGAHDAIYGLGQKACRFDRRGRNFILWNTDILCDGVLPRNRLHEADGALTGRSTTFDPYYTSIPFFYLCRADARAARMAGFFIDNGYKANFEFTEREVYRYQFAGGQYTEYVFAGPAMPEVLEGYTFVTGRMSAPPIWALGHHQCRFHDYTEEGICAIGTEYRERAIPCDVLWLDIGFMDGYRVFSWDKQKFPDVPAMLERLMSAKLRLVTIVDPGVKYEIGYPLFEEGRSRNLFCKTDSGQIYVGQVWPGRTAFPDFSKAETRTWWGDLNAAHVACGIAGIWNDMNEPATGEVEPFAMRFDRDGENHPHERFHNQYALLMAMATQEGLRKAAPRLRTFILSRAGFAGIQRYAAQWLGDNCSDWDHIEMSIPMSMGMGVSGQPFVGADIPGFAITPSPELAARWMQYGALTPFCRCHNEAGQPDQYPWSFGPGVEKRSRAALALRYTLLPYIYSAFMRACETGEPIQRPLAYDFQHDRHARETDDAYLFGEALLVAPVFKPGQTARHVYLPHGTWVDWHTGERHAGGEFITAAAPLDKIPVFARGGRVIPTYESAPLSTMGHYPDALELHLIVPDEQGDFESRLHEDDGVTHAFQEGAFVRTTFRVSRRGSRVTLSASTTGRGFPEFRRRRFVVVIHGWSAGNRLDVNGREARVEDCRASLENAGESFELAFSV